MNTLTSVSDQRKNWGVALPRDPAAVEAEREWKASRADRDPVTGMRPRLTAVEALALSRELTAEIRGLTTEEWMSHVDAGREGRA